MDPSLIALLDLPVRRTRSMARPGMLTSTRSGIGAELHASRPYELGDDPRLLDWNATARTGELQVRTTLADVALDVHLVPWMDASMRFATAGSKHVTARRGLEIVAAIAARRNERVVLHLPGAPLPLPVRNPELAVRDLLSRPPGWEDHQDLRARLRALGAPTSPSLVVAVLDPFVPDDVLDEIAVTADRRDVAVLFVADPAELAPPVGSFRLVSPSTGRRRTVRIDARTATRYRAALTERIDAVLSRLAAAGVFVVSLRTDEEVTRSMLEQLPQRR